MDNKIISKERILNMIEDLKQNSELCVINKMSLDLIINLDKIVFERNFFKNYMQHVCKEIEKINDDDYKLITLENEFLIFFEKTKKKYLKKENSADYVLYEYDNFYSFLLKNTNIDVSFLLKKIFPNNNVIKSVWIDDIKHIHEDLNKNNMKIEHISDFFKKENKKKKIVIYVYK